MTGHLDGPLDPDSPPPVSGSSGANIVHVGGPWYDVTVDGETERVRGRQAAEQLAEGVTSESRTDITEVITGRPVRQRESVVERFRGPAFAFDLARSPDPSSVHVERHDGLSPPFNLAGRTITRHGGHFGRGRWTVTYLPL